MLIKKPDDIRPSEITDEPVYRQRRRLLGAAGLALTGLAVGGGLLLQRRSKAMSKTPQTAALALPEPYSHYPSLPKGPFSSGEEPTDYTDATRYNNFYELGSSKEDPARNAGQLVTHPWSVRVEGECARPALYTLEDILRPHALEERVYRLRCVETWAAVIPWVGFSLGDLLKRFEPNSHARFVEFETLLDPKHLRAQRSHLLDWPYREGLRLDEAMHPLATLAVGMYGNELPNQNGAPLRLVVPWKYGFKSIKSIVAIRFLRERPPTTWNSLQPDEYGFYANVNPAVSHPRWSQARERRLGEWSKRETLPFNGYAEQVASLYAGMDLKRDF